MIQKVLIVHPVHSAVQTNPKRPHKIYPHSLRFFQFFGHKSLAVLSVELLPVDVIVVFA
jgi:hypothetical protein